VERSATPQAIKEAYRRLAFQYHRCIWVQPVDF
jgi:curved DNA-binding protein CbpA